jgi:hypothetical protein
VARLNFRVGPETVISRRGGAFGIADETVGEAEGKGVHGSRRRDPDLPVAEAAGPILHRRLGTRGKHLDGGRIVGKATEAARADRAGRGEFLRSDDLTEVFEIRLDPREGGRGEGFLHLCDGPLARGCGDDELGYEGIVVRRHHRSRGDPAVASNVLGKDDLGEQS